MSVKTILVVDDLFTLRQLVRHFLEREGYAVEEAHDGREALQKIAQSRPDLVLLDLMMPFMNGIQVLEQIQADAALRDIPILILTAVADKSQVVRYAHSETVDYLLKPFTRVTLLSRVGCALGEERPAT